MIETVFWVALACGLAGALAGNRTAWPLLASAALCLWIDKMGFPFDPAFWMMIDVLVALAIVRPEMTALDIAIVVLFIPAWVAYLIPDPARYTLALSVVIAQLMLTLPFGRCLAPVQRFCARVRASAEDRMLRGRHAFLR